MSKKEMEQAKAMNLEENDECVSDNDSSVSEGIEVGDKRKVGTDSTERFDRIEEIIVKAHNKCNVLDDKTRTKLFDDCTGCFLNEQMLMTNDELLRLATRICTIFQNENLDIYFTDENSRKSGILVNRYRNKLKNMRKNNLIAPSVRALNKLNKTTESEIYIISENEKISIDFLSQEQVMSITSVLSHWNATFDYRQNLLREEGRILVDILDQWKCTKFSFFRLLICEDFNKMHGKHCGNTLRLNWYKFLQNIEFLSTKVKDPATIRAVQDLPNQNEYVSVSMVLYLNAILYPPLKHKKYRPSIKNAQDSVLVKAADEKEIQIELDRFKKIWVKEDVEPHPLIFYMESAEGSLEFILIFDKIRHDFKNFFEAMDICYKLYSVLFIPFPFESKQFFHFLNETFYKIDLNEKKSSKTLILIQDLKAHQEHEKSQ